MADEMLILAEESFEGLIKFLFAIGFVLIWAVSAMVSWTKKQRGGQKAEQPSWQEILRDLQGGGADAGDAGTYAGGSVGGSAGQQHYPPQAPTQLPPRTARPMGRSKAQSQVRPPLPPKARPAPQVRREIPPQVRPQGPSQVRPQAQRRPNAAAQRKTGRPTQGRGGRMPVVPPLPVAATEAMFISQAEAPVMSAVARTGAAQLLLRQSLREQFILTELLRPPIALREEERQI